MIVVTNIIDRADCATASLVLLLEMFLWTRPSGRRAFGTTAEFAEKTKTLAANQGL